MIFQQEKECLTNETIAAWSDAAAQHYTQQAGKRALSNTKVRLAIEELLLKFRDCYGTDTPCEITGKKRFGSIYYELRQSGPRIDPTAQEEEGMQRSYDILARLKIKPKYTYNRRSRTNLVSVPVEQKPRKNKGLILILSAVLLAVLLAVGLKAGAPDFATLLHDNLTAPVFKKMTAVLAALATPLVFLAVITGIVGVGDVSSFGKLGGKVLTSMGITYLIAAAALGVCVVVGYPLQSTGTNGEGGIFAQVLQLVLDIIPDNLVVPFGTDNDLQVIAIAIFVGIVMLVLGKQLRTLPVVIQEAADLVNKMMAIVCELLPLIVFLGVFNLLITSDIADFASIYKVFVYFIAGSAVVLAVSTIRACRLTKVSAGTIIRKTMATFMINITTSSQVAALPENMHCCKDKFGIDGRLVDFGLPLGVVVFMPCGAIFLGLTAVSLADISGIALTVPSLIQVLAVSVILAIAAPPIPGSAFAVLPILFTALGIPDTVYPLAVVLGTIVGYLLPAVNGYLLQVEMLVVAAKTGKIDLDVLRDPDAA